MGTAVQESALSTEARQLSPLSCRKVAQEWEAAAEVSGTVSRGKRCCRRRLR
jgi:hypothetical protein